MSPLFKDFFEFYDFFKGEALNKLTNLVIV